MTSRFLQLSLQAQKNSGYLANRLLYQFVTPLTTSSHIFVGYHGLKLLSTWHDSTRKYPKMWICLFCDKKHQNTCTGDCTGLHKSIFGVTVEEVWLLAMSAKTSINIMFEVSSSSAEGIPRSWNQRCQYSNLWNSFVLICNLIVLNYIRI